VNSKLETKHSAGGYEDDDIQEVIPLDKSEPLVAAAGEQQQLQQHALVAPAMADDYSGGGQLVSDEYGEDYADYEGGGYEGDGGSYDGSGMEGSLGGGGASADGNKGRAKLLFCCIVS
jgi:hypothetical protein